MSLPTRPAKNHPTSIYIKMTLKEAVIAQAKKENRNMNNMINVLIERGLQATPQ